DEGAGILNWVVEGFLRWREHGLEIPNKVVAATEEYREAEDTLLTFIQERMVAGPNESAYTDDVYRAWVAWSEARGERAGSSRELTEKIKARGIPVMVGTANRRRFAGLSLTTAPSEM